MMQRKCKSCISFQGKGDMNTYWLLSEDDERIQKRFGSTSEMQQNSLRMLLRSFPSVRSTN